MSIGTFREWLRESELNKSLDLSSVKTLKDVKEILDDERWFQVIETEIKDDELFVVIDKKFITQKIADDIQRRSNSRVSVKTIRPKKVGDPTIVITL